MQSVLMFFFIEVKNNSRFLTFGLSLIKILTPKKIRISASSHQNINVKFILIVFTVQKSSDIVEFFCFH
jgi:hypothetical protein